MMKRILCILAALSLHISALAQNFVIAWDYPTLVADGVTQFRIYILGTSPTLIATVNAPSLTANISLPTSATPYTIVCRAVNATGESADSNQLLIRVSLPSPPTNLRKQ